VPRPGRLRRRTRTVAIVAVPLGLLLAAMLVARHLWLGVGDTAIGTGGLVILGVGGVVTLALGAVPITLMIVSGRRGHDDADDARPRRRVGEQKARTSGKGKAAPREAAGGVPPTSPPILRSSRTGGRTAA
jgi:hypothetical protein